MSQFLTLLWRGLLLRCPVCGQGKLFKGPFTMHERCPVCEFKFEREEGYFSSSMAINLVISEFIVTAIVLPVAFNPAIPIIPVLLAITPLVVILPLLFYRHSRGLWLTTDHFFHPARGDELPQPYRFGRTRVK